MVNRIGKLTKHAGTVIKLVDLAAKLYLPGALSEPTSYALDHLREYLQKRGEERLQEFHSRLLEAEDGIPLSEEAEISEADYHALLNACLADIEDEKTVAFAYLAKSIAKGKIHKDYRRHFILALRDLSFDQLDFLRKLYVVSKYPIPPKEGPGNRTVKSELANLRAGTVADLAFTALHSRGFLTREGLTDIGNSFVTEITPDEFLQPGAYDLETWSGAKCQVISALRNNAAEIKIISAIQNKLRNEMVESRSIICLGGINARLSQTRLFSNCGILLTDESLELTEEQEHYLRDLTSKVPYVQVLIGKNLKEKPYGELVYFTEGSPQSSELDSMINALVVQINKMKS